MIAIKSIVHYTDTNSLEVTWVERSTNDGVVSDAIVKCHSYADVQMAMFRADVAEFGGDIANYEAMIATVEAGIVPVETPAPVVPDRIEALQGLLVLDAAGLSVAYEAWASSPDRTFAEKAFINKAMHWRRDDPTLLAAASSLGLSSAQVDALFISGAAL